MGRSSRFAPEAWARSFAALRVADYRRWSVVQLLSGAGAAMAQIAVAWLVVELTGNGLALGLVAASVMVPMLVLGPFIGALVDRFTRRSVLIVTACVQMLLAGCLAAVAFSGFLQVWMLAAFSLAYGVALAADNPARQLLVLDLVGRERITSAVSMNEIIINSARVVGPAVAGLLLAVAEPAWCFAVNALLFVPSLLVLWRLRVAPQPAADPGDAEAAPPGAWRFAALTPAVRSTLLLAVCASASCNIAVVMPLIVADVFGADGATYGLLVVAFGLGALPGAFFSATGPSTPRGGEVRALALATGAAVLAAAVSWTLPMLFVTLAVVGAVVMWFIARANAFVMLATPAPIRGRVMGIWAMALPGSNVVTGIAVGALAEASDPRIAYSVVGAATAIVTCLCWRALTRAATSPLR